MPFRVGIIISNEPTYLGRKFNYNETILAIKQYYYDNENNSQAVSTMKLVHNGTTLQNNRTIEYYDDDIDRAFLCVLTFTSNGGSSTTDEAKSEYKDDINNNKKEIKKYKIGLKIKNRKRTIKDSHKKKLKISNKECKLYGTKGTNIEMECGHVLSSEAAFDIVHDILSKNRSQTKLECPYCKKEWKFKYWSRAACLYDDEYDIIYGELQNRMAPERKKCPNCGIPNNKPDNLKMLRIACQCNKHDWCWFCGNKWIGGGFTVCGNKNCVSDEINKTLKNCPMKNLGKDYGNIIVPSYRACPQCHTLTEHTSACKHMICTNSKCKYHFCFSCLKGKNKDGTWPCKGYSFKCPPAPRQILK